MSWKHIFLTAVFLVAITRIPVAPARLNVEGVNLAFAMEQLDPSHEQPHAPGFPFFVVAARLLASFIPRAEWTFLLISVLVSAACLIVMYKVASAIYSGWEARAASLLLLVNPIFWFAGLQSPVWPYLCLFSLLAGWFAWRAWDGDDRSVTLGAATLAVAFGVLPEAVLYLFPLWLLSGWIGGSSWTAILRGLAIILAGVVLALDILWVGLANMQALAGMLSEYPFGTEVPSADFLIREPRLWVRSLGRFVSWNLITVSVWAWVLLLLPRKTVFPPLKKNLWFFLLWCLPAAIVHTVGGLSGPEQILVYIPALCLIGGGVLGATGQEGDERLGLQTRETSLMIALVASVLLFGEFVRLPAPNGATPSGGIRRVLDVATYSIWETSLGPLRWSNEVADTSLWEVGNLVRTDKPTVLVALDRPEQDLQSVGWRLVSYYESNHDIWVLVGSEAENEARRTRGKTVVEVLKGSSIVIPLPKGARILWLVNPDDEFMAEAKAKLPVRLSRKYVMYTDLPADAADFRIGAFVFRPS